MLQPGIYEQIIDEELKETLSEIPDQRKAIGPIEKAEASKILSRYLADIVEKSLENSIDKDDSLNKQIDLINEIIAVIKRRTDENDCRNFLISENAEQLLALLNENDPLLALGRNALHVIRPETSISQSSLFTGAVHEPSLDSEFKKEILTSDHIDMLVSFIKWSGLRLLYEELKSFTQKGGKLRIITTSYMGATDVKAIEELRKLPNTKIKVSYDTKRTRLHAKTYVFYRNTGFTTAYVGSSNLSNVAMTSGLEWNVKVTAKDQPDTLKKIEATFESYWFAQEFEEYTEESKEKLAQAIKTERNKTNSTEQVFSFDIYPYPFQQEILDKLNAERKVRGNNRNLVVAATGTGKTVVSAFDYKRHCNENKGSSNRLLFIAHREEILKQSLACFRGVLRDPNFGELFVGGYRPESIDHLFMSIQTFNSQSWIDKTHKGFYDYIVVDEFHHAAAPTYKKLLTHYEPKILLGLTATPERMDGQSIFSYFNDRIAAEIRLPEAIDRKLLSPFQYFGITDEIDLRDVKWERGGYDIRELSNVYTLNTEAAKRRCNMIIKSLSRYSTDTGEIKGLGFCVSVAHANFMAEYFVNHGIPSLALTGDAPNEVRNNAKKKLLSGQIRFIFVVDIYNEGVDIPEVNTVMFLRPTESLTIFLQQLGRGLRLAENKECLTVFDFIGQANKKYTFEDKFVALLSNTTGEFKERLGKAFLMFQKAVTFS
ncbi:MAG: DEAD/DEAH box helicase family protein [Thiohalomonadaceae bacterium]